MIKYTKIESNGNNFLLFDNSVHSYKDEVLRKICVKDCDVNKGFGADGLLVLDKSLKGSFLMRLFNKNGEEGEMCGNGARCIAYWANKNSLLLGDFVFETPAGMIGAKVDENRVLIDMGEISLSDIGERVHISLFGHSISYYSLRVGVPHIVIPLNKGQLSFGEMLKIGAILREDKDRFPRGSNVNFMVKEQGDLYVNTYERGVEGITASCGTGSCASAIVSMLDDFEGGKVKVINPGGINWVDLKKVHDKVKIGLEGVVSISGEILSYIDINT